MASLWAAGFGAVHFLLRRHAKAALLLGAVVLSHWLLDYATHRPDLPLFPGGEKVGLGLWNSLPWTLGIELGLFGLGVYFYEASTRARDKVGGRGFGLFVLVLIVTYVGNVFGPPPPAETRAIAGAGVAMWILFAWAFWFDRHRTSQAPVPA
jgi:hypothetical protein